MNTDVVIAASATVIATASLSVSIYEARAARHHNRLSVQPVLQFGTRWRDGDTAGIRLANVGLGLAAVIETSLCLDGKCLGQFNKANVDQIRDTLSVHVRAATLGGTPVLSSDYDQFLLSVEGYDPTRDAEFRALADKRIQIKIRYESLYGGDARTVPLRREP